LTTRFEDLSRFGIDISEVLRQLGTLWWDTIWPSVTAMVIEPMLWLSLAALVFGSRVISAADLWRRGRPVTVRTRRAEVRVGDRQRRVALEVQEAFFGDLNDKYLPTFQSLRLVLGVGATFFAAYILCYGVLVTGQEWLRRGIYLSLGGQPATFWSVAGPPIDLLCMVALEPLRWALLATSFHACLSMFTARAEGTTTVESDVPAENPASAKALDGVVSQGSPRHDLSSADTSSEDRR